MLNRYTYAANNPLKFTDPTGHFLDYDIGPSLNFNYYVPSSDSYNFDSGGSGGYNLGGSLNFNSDILNFGSSFSFSGSSLSGNYSFSGGGGGLNFGGGSSLVIGAGISAIGGGSSPETTQNQSGLNIENSFSTDFRNRLETTNDFFFSYPTGLTRTLIGLGTAGSVAESFGTVTTLQALSSLPAGGVANLGISGTLISAGATIVINTSLVALSLETGIIIGSAFGAAVVDPIDRLIVNVAGE